MLLHPGTDGLTDVSHWPGNACLEDVNGILSQHADGQVRTEEEENDNAFLCDTISDE